MNRYTVASSAVQLQMVKTFSSNEVMQSLYNALCVDKVSVFIANNICLRHKRTDFERDHCHLFYWPTHANDRPSSSSTLLFHFRC